MIHLIILRLPIFYLTISEYEKIKNKKSKIISYQFPTD